MVPGDGIINVQITNSVKRIAYFSVVGGYHVGRGGGGYNSPRTQNTPHVISEPVVLCGTLLSVFQPTPRVCTADHNTTSDYEHQARDHEMSA